MSDAEQVEPVEPDLVAQGMPSWVPGAIKAARWPLVFALVAAGILLLTFQWLVGQLGSFLTMIGIALFLSFALEPAVDYLASRGWKRGAATGLIFLIVFGVIVLLVALIVPAVISGFKQLVPNAPALVDRLFLEKHLRFEQIVEGLSLFTKRWVVVGFRADNEVANFAETLLGRFRIIEVIAAGSQPRVLFLCEQSPTT